MEEPFICCSSRSFRGQKSFGSEQSASPDVWGAHERGQVGTLTCAGGLHALHVPSKRQRVFCYVLHVSPGPGTGICRLKLNIVVLGVQILEIGCLEMASKSEQVPVLATSALSTCAEFLGMGVHQIRMDYEGGWSIEPDIYTAGYILIFTFKLFRW